MILDFCHGGGDCGTCCSTVGVMADLKSAAIWARVSTPGQKELSPEGRVDRARALLESKGYEARYVFKTVWTSTDLEPSPEFQQLRQLIMSRRIHALACLDRDRLECSGVGGIDRIVFLTMCRENGVEPMVCQADSQEPLVRRQSSRFPMGEGRAEAEAQQPDVRTLQRERAA